MQTRYARDKRRVGPRAPRARTKRRSWRPLKRRTRARDRARVTARGEVCESVHTNMLSVSTSSRSLASAPTARRGWRGRRGGSRLETVRRAQIGVDLVDAARNGLETFVQRVRYRQARDSDLKSIGARRQSDVKSGFVASRRTLSVKQTSANATKIEADRFIFIRRHRRRYQYCLDTTILSKSSGKTSR
jgi:hypothetical protein